METVAISIDTESQEQADEFAFLMAAAPELAKALEGLIACISETRGETADNALHEARAALAKSRGES